CGKATSHAEFSCLLHLGHFPDKRNLFGPIGGAVGPKDFVKPDCRLAIGGGMLPVAPKKISLGFSAHHPPVECRDVETLSNRQCSLKRPPFPARHNFPPEYCPRNG